MKKRLLLSGIALAALAIAAPASAADVPGRGPIYKAAPAPLFNWTGFYIGGHGGYGWADADNLDPKGWFGGGQVGYNWQYAPNCVFGVEADISGSDISETNLAGAPLVSSKINYFGTARGRLGYTVDRVMVYGTGGLAWAHNRANDGLVQADATQVGWTAGRAIDRNDPEREKPRVSARGFFLVRARVQCGTVSAKAGTLRANSWSHFTSFGCVLRQSVPKRKSR